MEVTRIFHPVGQGGFYTESFDDQYMVVYDCGGSDMKSMKAYIDLFLSEIPEQPIEAVFISHLHEDHINGLQHLIDKTSVKRIFLPQLTKEKVLDVLLYNALHSSKINSNDFIISFIDTIRLERNFGNVAIIQVQESEMRERANVEAISIDSSSTQVPPFMPSGTPLTVNNLWYYIPYNPAFSSLSFDRISDKQMRETLINIYNDPSAKSQAEKIAELIKTKGVEACKNAYAGLFGRIHNGQSMPVFSGLFKPRGTTTTIEIGHVSNPIEPVRWSRQIYIDNHNYNCELELYVNIDNRYPCIVHCHPHIIHCRRAYNIITNFLYTGDFEATNVTSLKNYFFGHLWESICGIQIPHHGSRHNYTPDLYYGKLYAIASAGIRNKYHHPNIDTLMNIATNGCFPCVITEDVITAIYQHFNIK